MSSQNLEGFKVFVRADRAWEIYRQQKNIGIIANFEFLIDKVRSDYFMFADQDDVWKEDKIEKTLKVLEETDSDLVYTDLEVVNSRLKPIAPSYWELKGFSNKIKKYNNFKSLYLNNYITGCTMMVRSKWINSFLPFPKNSKYVLHDYWVSLVVSQEGKISYIDEKLMLYRQHTNNKIGSKTKSEELKTLDEIRNLFLEVKIEHFKTFIDNEKIFKEMEVRELNKKALQYFERLKNVKNFNFSEWGLFFKLYKYEDFKYKMKNFLILNMPFFARIVFKHMPSKQSEKGM